MGRGWDEEQKQKDDAAARYTSQGGKTPIVSRMKMFLMLLCMFLAIDGERSPAQDSEPVMHQFSLWGTLETQNDKLSLYWGFTNGFFAGPRSPLFIALANCIEAHIKSSQALAMIDKYYKDNPQRWNIPLGIGVVEALTVRDGPCANKSPWK
jgi:hypothetical protein